ncbi:MAG: 16S rRNA (guanine(527)-N(7))-methyltransferase RsmG [Gammaproteobacteria bacterium]|nr:16S rRNA (guanine(527)-N(7))-methyltransferase RsmG [Gammaproteobacteria bacterium]
MNKNYQNTQQRDNADLAIKDLIPLLNSGLNKLNLKLSETTLEKIIAYIALLDKWNKVHNLTSIRDPKSILIRHIFDSLAIAPFIKGPNILDFGTGGGLPGIPLALALPKYNFVLLDSALKKTTFLNHVILALKIKNVNVITKRIEEFHFDPLFATIVTRATAKSDMIIDKTRHLCAKHGQILIMKGKDPKEELKSINNHFELYKIKVPYLNEDRCLIKIPNEIS